MLLYQKDRVPYYVDPYYNYNEVINISMTPAQFKRWAEDGRPHSKMTEYQAQNIPFMIRGKLAKYTVPEKETKGIDGFFKTDRKDYRVSFKTLTNRILYQCSRFNGTRRTCTIKNLIYSLKQADFTVACDIRPVGQWTYWVLDNQMLLEEVENGFLDKNGHQRYQFKSFLEDYGYIKPEKIEVNNVRFAGV